MRTLESIFKVLFVVFAGYFTYVFVHMNVLDWVALVFSAICILLGLLLIFNKKSSYGYKCSPRDYLMRRFEGIILIVFAVFLVTMVCNVYAAGMY